MTVSAWQENIDLHILLPLPDEEVVGIVFNSYDFALDHCLPCVLYLCIKYQDSPAKAMTASANLGGDAAHRTALIGALMGDQPTRPPHSSHARHHTRYHSKGFSKPSITLPLCSLPGRANATVSVCRICRCDPWVHGNTVGVEGRAQRSRAPRR